MHVHIHNIRSVCALVSAVWQGWAMISWEHAFTVQHLKLSLVNYVELWTMCWEPPTFSHMTGLLHHCHLEILISAGGASLRNTSTDLPWKECSILKGQINKKMFWGCNNSFYWCRVRGGGWGGRGVGWVVNQQRLIVSSTDWWCSEHEACIVDLNELQWHLAYTTRNQAKAQQRKDSAELMNNRLKEDIDFVRKHM